MTVVFQQISVGGGSYCFHWNYISYSFYFPLVTKITSLHNSSGADVLSILPVLPAIDHCLRYSITVHPLPAGKSPYLLPLWWQSSWVLPPDTICFRDSPPAQSPLFHHPLWPDIPSNLMLMLNTQDLTPPGWPELHTPVLKLFSYSLPLFKDFRYQFF